MNKDCPTCGCVLFKQGTVELQEWRDGWMEVVQQPPDLVPYSEEQRPENRAESDGPGPIGGLWFCSEDCRDEYRREQEQEESV